MLPATFYDSVGVTLSLMTFLSFENVNNSNFQLNFDFSAEELQFIHANDIVASALLPKHDVFLKSRPFQPEQKPFELDSLCKSSTNLSFENELKHALSVKIDTLECIKAKLLQQMECISSSTEILTNIEALARSNAESVAKLKHSFDEWLTSKTEAHEREKKKKLQVSFVERAASIVDDCKSPSLLLNTANLIEVSQFVHAAIDFFLSSEKNTKHELFPAYADAALILCSTAANILTSKLMLMTHHVSPSIYACKEEFQKMFFAQYFSFGSFFADIYGVVAKFDGVRAEECQFIYCKSRFPHLQQFLESFEARLLSNELSQERWPEAFDELKGLYQREKDLFVSIFGTVSSNCQEQRLAEYLRMCFVSKFTPFFALKLSLEKDLKILQNFVAKVADCNDSNLHDSVFDMLRLDIRHCSENTWNAFKNRLKNISATSNPFDDEFFDQLKIFYSVFETLSQIQKESYETLLVEAANTGFSLLLIQPNGNQRLDAAKNWQAFLHAHSHTQPIGLFCISDDVKCEIPQNLLVM